MARLALGFVMAGVIVAAGLAGCCTTASSGTVTPELQPVQGNWRITAASKSDGVFSPLVGTDVTVKGNMLTMAAPAAGGATTAPAMLARELELTPGQGAMWNINIKPAKGQAGWTMHGIAMVDKDTWTMHVVKAGEDANLTDFLPRDDAGDVVVLKRE
jgi:hypothetical protein